MVLPGPTTRRSVVRRRISGEQFVVNRRVDRFIVLVLVVEVVAACREFGELGSHKYVAQGGRCMNVLVPLPLPLPLSLSVTHTHTPGPGVCAERRMPLMASSLCTPCAFLCVLVCIHYTALVSACVAKPQVEGCPLHPLRTGTGNVCALAQYPMVREGLRRHKKGQRKPGSACMQAGHADRCLNLGRTLTE